MNNFESNNIPNEGYKEEDKELSKVEDEDKHRATSQDTNNLEQAPDNLEEKKYNLEEKKYNLEERNSRISCAGLLVTVITVIVLFLNYVNGKSQLDNAIEQTKQNQTKIENESAFNKKRLNTEMFSRATEQLGKSDEASETARVGAIYTLEQIAKDSPEDNWKIMNVLTFYVREKDVYSQELQPGYIRKKVRDDVQLILEVIGRREHENDPEGKTLRLSDSQLHGAYLEGAYFKGANFVGSQLLHTILTNADLSEALLTNADLRGANLKNTNLSGTILCGADLRQARNLTVEQVKSAKHWEGAIYDEDFRQKLKLPPKNQGLPDCLKTSS